MRSRLELALHLIEHAFRVLEANVENVTLGEALFVPEGGYRSILGTLKHVAGWSHVYHSYAFGDDPKHWKQIDWPHGLRDTIVPSEQYLADVIEWFEQSHRQWLQSLNGIRESELDELRPSHWGEEIPLFDIVMRIAGHHIYHAGELNQILSICRGETWEEGEEVEENNISTVGHRVRPPWLADAEP